MDWAAITYHYLISTTLLIHIIYQNWTQKWPYFYIGGNDNVTIKYT